MRQIDNFSHFHRGNTGLRNRDNLKRKLSASDLIILGGSLEYHLIAVTKIIIYDIYNAISCDHRLNQEPAFKISKSQMKQQRESDIKKLIKAI